MQNPIMATPVAPGAASQTNTGSLGDQPNPPPTSATPGSQSTGKRAAADGDDNSSSTKQRKRRMQYSCGECQRRKIKCDRKDPCSACIKRKIPYLCRWDDDEDPDNPYAMASDVRHLSRRLASLESILQQEYPRYFPYGGAASSSAPESSASPYKPVLAPEAEADGDAEGDAADSSDTENAATNLEGVAFGARVNVVKAISAALHTQKRVLPPHSEMELTDALTSILVEPLSYDQDGRPRSAVRLGLDLAVTTHSLLSARSTAMHQIFSVLPDREISLFLIDKYFAEMEWDFAVLDPFAFAQEYERYEVMVSSGRHDNIDPFWIALYCMVLALALEGFWSRPGGRRSLGLFRGLAEHDLQQLPSVWHDAALRALQLGEFGGTPRIRTVQCIVLLGQYIQIRSSSGQQGRFLTWAASAVRVAQRLGLHRLGSDGMPPDDPALPPGRNAFKREAAVRLFAMLEYIDAVLSDSPLFRAYLLHPAQCTTTSPRNVNWQTLDRGGMPATTPGSFSSFSGSFSTFPTTFPSPTGGNTALGFPVGRDAAFPPSRDAAFPGAAPGPAGQPVPRIPHTTSSFTIAQHTLARAIKRNLDTLVLSREPFAYSRVLAQDLAFKDVLLTCSDVYREDYAGTLDPRTAYERCSLHSEVHSRLVRLHRPFLARGFRQRSPYAFSTAQCLTSARRVIDANYAALSVTNAPWWVYTATLASTIVLFMDMFHAVDGGASEAELKERNVPLGRASLIFESRVLSPALQAVIDQGRRIMHGLFVALDVRRRGSGEPEPFAHILKRISAEIRREERRDAEREAGHVTNPFPMQAYSPSYLRPDGANHVMVGSERERPERPERSESGGGGDSGGGGGGGGSGGGSGSSGGNSGGHSGSGGAPRSNSAGGSRSSNAGNAGDFGKSSSSAPAGPSAPLPSLSSLAAPLPVPSTVADVSLDPNDSAFYATLTSADWNVQFRGTSDEADSALLGQMAATW